MSIYATVRPEIAKIAEMSVMQPAYQKSAKQRSGTHRTKIGSTDNLAAEVLTIENFSKGLLLKSFGVGFARLSSHSHQTLQVQ